jgi:hypothetical protein
MIDKALFNYIKDKDIAVLGNAKSILNKKHAIDDHEIVVRINKGFPQEYTGERTDILALSLPLTKGEILDNYSPRFIVWCTPKYDKMTQYLREVCLYFPQGNWKLLYNALGARPSTGCMIVAYLYPYCKSMTLYGFDFWKTPNYYTDVIHTGQHNPKAEQLFLNYMIKDKGQIIK